MDTNPQSLGDSNSLSVSQKFLQQVFGPASTPTTGGTDAMMPMLGNFAGHFFDPSLGTSEVSPLSGSSAARETTETAQLSIPFPVAEAIARNSRGHDPAGIDATRLSGLIEALRQQSSTAVDHRLRPGKHVPAGGDGLKDASGTSTRGTTSRSSSSSRPFDVHSIRADFPALHQSINGHPLVWFDNAATTQKPQSVIDAMSRFYALDYSNIHRAAHTLAARATDHYEAARQTVREFIHADSNNDIVFVRGTTEGINLIANTLKGELREGDEILLTEMEHHANIVPWQIISRETRARIRVIPFGDQGEILLEEYKRLLSPRTKVVSLTHASNTLGTILPVAEMAQMAHHYGARVVVDGAQSIAHLRVDVKALGVDFFVFSGHKIYAPTGIGAVYIHPDLHDRLPPWQGGGNMIRRVTFDETIYADAPAKFEAGTPSIGDAVGLGAALNYLRQFDASAMEQHEHVLLEHATHQLKPIPGVKIFGNAPNKVGLVSFTLDGYSTDAVGKEFDRHGIAVRTGHHCAQPSLRHYGLESTVRPSFAIYNTHDEIDCMVDIVRHMAKKK